MKIYEDKDFWEESVKIGQKTIKKNQNEVQTSKMVKEGMVKAELAAYEGRNNAAYESEWKRFIQSNEFKKKIRG